MIFRIDFNKENDPSALLKLGAIESEVGFYELEIKDFEDMQKLQNNLRSIFAYRDYGMIIDFEPGDNTIFFDGNL